MLPKGVQIAVLAGDPGKKGPFVVRQKVSIVHMDAPFSGDFAVRPHQSISGR
jgi:hypothetical protein